MYRMLRVVSVAVLAAALLGLVAAPEPAQAATFAVNSSNDESDANPGDGVCRSSPSQQCTLRAAIVEANALAGADVITVPAMTIHLHIIGSDDTGLLGDLDIRQDLRITGAGSGLTVIDASRISPGERVFDIHPDLDVRLADLKSPAAERRATAPAVMGAAFASAGTPSCAWGVSSSKAIRRPGPVAG